MSVFANDTGVTKSVLSNFLDWQKVYKIPPGNNLLMESLVSLELEFEMAASTTKM